MSRIDKYFQTNWKVYLRRDAARGVPLRFVLGKELKFYQNLLAASIRHFYHS